MSLLVRSLLARAPACLLCNGTRVRRSSQSYGALIGAIFVAVRCQECGRRFPLPRHVAATHVTMYSQIPAAAANKTAIELALTDALRAVPGDWVIEVRGASQPDRWAVNMRRAGGATVRLSLAPRDLGQEAAYERVRDALRKEGLVG